MKEQITNSNEKRGIGIAGAGTGKTHNAIKLAENTQGRVLFLAFTAHAAEEIRSRYRYDNAYITTIDALALKLMHKQGIHLEVILEQRKRKYGKMFPLEAIDLQHCQVDNVNEEYRDALEADRYIDFGLIIQLVTKFPVECLRQDYDLIIVDECQDINPVQWHFINLLCGEARLFLIGDPRQNIFEFRGADYAILDDFLKIATRYELTENYRSFQEILDVANNYSYQIDSGFGQLISNRGYNGSETVQRIEHNQLFNKLKECVLTETVIISFKNETLGVLKGQLKRLGFKCQETYSLYARKNIKDVIAIMNMLTHPHDDYIERVLKLLPNIGEAAIKSIKFYNEKQSFLTNLLAVGSQCAQGRCELHLADTKKKTIAEFVDCILTYGDLDENPIPNIMTISQYLEIEEDVYYEQFIKELQNEGVSSIDDVANFMDSIKSDERISNSIEKGIDFKTFHKMKGSEKPCVFVIADDFNANHKINEKLRLMYVGVTRARDRLIIVGKDNVFDRNIQLPPIQHLVAEAVKSRVEAEGIKNIQVSIHNIPSSAYDDFYMKLNAFPCNSPMDLSDVERFKTKYPEYYKVSFSCEYSD
jgi:superfamily I DNA/RNA helicase